MLTQSRCIPGMFNHPPVAGRKAQELIGGVFYLLSSYYQSQEIILDDRGPSAVFWYERSGRCKKERWNIQAIPWKGSKKTQGQPCRLWWPEKAGQALERAIGKVVMEQHPQETVIYWDVLGITFANQFWIVPISVDEVLAVMRQSPFPLQESEN